MKGNNYMKKEFIDKIISVILFLVIIGIFSVPVKHGAEQNPVPEEGALRFQPSSIKFKNFFH